MSPAKRRSNRGAPPSSKGSSVAPSSRTNGPKAKPKGRVPVAEEGSRSARRGRSAGAGASGKGTAGKGTTAKAAAGKGAGGKGRTADGAEVVEAEVVEGELVEGEGRVKPPYGAGALFLAFLVGIALQGVAFGFAQANTDYDFQVPTGVGAAVGQAASQTATGQPLDIGVPPPMWLTLLTQIPLWLGLGLIPVWFAVKKGKGVVADLGLRMKAIDVPVGLAVGVASQLLMVPALYWLLFKVTGSKDVSAAARELTDRAGDPFSILLVFVIVVIGAPLAEEIYFRGFAQRIFARKVAPAWAILFSAVFFALTHGQLLQLPALLIFGLILGVMAWRSGRLGPAIWAHVGFNAVTAATLLFSLG